MQSISGTLQLVTYWQLRTPAAVVHYCEKPIHSNDNMITTRLPTDDKHILTSHENHNIEQDYHKITIKDTSNTAHYPCTPEMSKSSFRQFYLLPWYQQLITIGHSNLPVCVPAVQRVHDLLRIMETEHGFVAVVSDHTIMTGTACCNKSQTNIYFALVNTVS